MKRCWEVMHHNFFYLRVTHIGIQTELHLFHYTFLHTGPYFRVVLPLNWIVLINIMNCKASMSVSVRYCAVIEFLTAENMPLTDIHQWMTVFLWRGMCSHRYCSTLGCTCSWWKTSVGLQFSVTLKAWCIPSSCLLAQALTLSSIGKHWKCEQRVHYVGHPVLQHNNSAWLHTSVRTDTQTCHCGFTVLDHRPYGPDLVPSDFRMFSNLKEHFRGQWSQDSG